MSSETVAAAVDAHPPATEPVRRRVRVGPQPRPWRRACFTVLGLLILAVAWLGVRGALAIRQLGQARSAITSAQADLTAGRTGAASTLLLAAQSHSLRAQHLTGDFVWHLAGHTPVVGVNLRTVHAVAAAAQTSTAAASPLLVQLSDDLESHKLRTASGSLDLSVLTALTPALAHADNGITAAAADLASTGSGGLGPVVRSRNSFASQLTAIDATVEAAQRVVGLAPAMLGADGPRHYFVAFQNPAEARGTGGFLGAFAIVTADRGQLHLDGVGSDDQLISQPAPAVTVSPEFTARYRTLGGDSFWGNGNLTPDFGDASTVWLALWAKQTGQHLDGVIGMDPEVTGAIVSATGPLTLPDGTTLSGAEVPQYVESGEYLRYPTDSAARRTQIRALVSKAFGEVTGGAGEASTLISVLSHATQAGQLQLMSSHPAEQAALVAGGVSGTIPEQPGPFAALVVNNDGANKMDYYLRRSLTYSSLGCSAPMRTTTITVTLRNTGPASGLPLYVSGSDAKNPAGLFALGTDRSLVSVYAAQGAVLASATLDGRPTTLTPQTEHSHPVFSTRIDILPGQTRTLVLHTTEPSSGAAVPYTGQALSSPAAITLKTADCPVDTPLAATG